MLSTTRRRLGDLPVKEFVRAQRKFGRAALPAEVVSDWAAHHDYALELLRDRSSTGRVRRLAQFISDISYSVATFSTRPIDRFVSYYPYTDLQILDRFIKCARRDFRSQIQKAAEGTFLMVMALDNFEHKSRNGREKNYRHSFNRTVNAKRLDQLTDAFTACERLLSSVGGDADELTSSSADIEIEELATDPTQRAVVVEFSGFPQSQCHDEMAFLRTIHISEFCFTGIRLATEEAMDRMSKSDWTSAVECLRDANGFADVLHKGFLVLRTMPPEHFAEFRDATGQSSAVQSVNYQQMDVVLHGFNPFKQTTCEDNPHLRHILEFAHPEFISLRQIVRRLDVQIADVEAVIACAKQLDAKLTSWRGLHLAFAKAYLPPDAAGTGNTVGAPYLKEVLGWSIFDDTEPDYELIAAEFPSIEIESLFHVSPWIEIAPREDERQ